MTRRVLVAGVGNVFCTDDGFGSVVAQRLTPAYRAGELGEGVELVDYGIRGVHLAYQMLEEYDLVVLVDAVQRRQPPGTLYVIEHDHERAEEHHRAQVESAGFDPDELAQSSPMMDAHDMSPDAILALVPRLGGTVGRVVVVGCEPADLGPGMELTAAVEAALPEAERMVRDVLAGKLPAPSP